MKPIKNTDCVHDDPIPVFPDTLDHLLERKRKTMRHEENNRNNQTSETSDFLHDKMNTGQLFECIMTDLDLDPSCSPRSGMKYRARFIRRCLIKGMLAAAAVGLFVFSGTGIVQKPRSPVSKPLHHRTLPAQRSPSMWTRSSLSAKSMLL